MKKYIGEHFNNIGQLLRANEQPVNNTFTGRPLASDKSDMSFTKTRSYKEAAELITNGYEEPVEKIKRGVTQNVRNYAASKTAVKTDIVGYAPCVPNALLGLPNSMLNKATSVKKSKVVSIVYDATGAWHVDAEEFIKSGVAVLSAISNLEMSGYRVELKVAFLNASGDSQNMFSTVTLKDWRQPLDIKKITFPICHPSMLRRIGFRQIETIPTLTDRDYTSGYGTSRVSVSGYEGAKRMEDELRKAKKLADHERYTNLIINQHCGYNPEEILKHLGLK